MNHSSRKVIIPELPQEYADFFLTDNRQDFSARFDQLGRPGAVDTVPWQEFPDRPEAAFRIAWSGRYLIVKFYVREREILGRFRKDQEPVYRDSCVELFLSPQGKDYYYNFEFNCLGTCLAQVGSDRSDREPLDEAVLSRIVRLSSLGKEPCHERFEGPLSEADSWSLLAAIPVDCLVRDDLQDFAGQKFTGNLYKCGDDLTTPHYLSWNPVGSEEPDYHRPEFFGELWCS